MPKRKESSMNCAAHYSPLLGRFRISLIMASGVLALAGCTVGPKYKPPITTAPPAFKEVAPERSADGTMWKTAKPQDTAPRGPWWEIYGDPELNQLETRLNSSNQNIAQSFQNFMAARALVRQARSSYFPQITAGPSYTRSRTSANQAGTQAANSNLNSNAFNLPLDVSWELDVWGRIRSTVREFANEAQVSAADLANVKLSEQASLAVYFFQLRGQDSQIALYQQTLDAYRKTLGLTKALNKAGIDSSQSVAEADLSVKTAEAALTDLRIARAQYEHAIALLIGQPAASFSLPVRELTAVAPDVPAGVPSELLERRPDIAAAERTMAAANALIDVQTAAFYPTFSIAAEGGFASPKITDWLTWPSRFFSIGPTATQTLFDAGARRATLANYQAQYEADAAAYRQTVLTAFQQTEDNLAAQRYLSDELIQQQAAIDAAQKYLSLANTLFRTGVDSFIDVYTAQNALLTQQQTYIRLHISQMTSNVQLIESLGGGWNRAQLPTEKQVAAK